jgi:hypothetical protein
MLIQNISIYFDTPRRFNLSAINSLGGIVGLYFIFHPNVFIDYPFQKSKLLYIGISEKKTNSISSRLQGHYVGLSKNIGLLNYRKGSPLLFTYLNYEVFQESWKLRIEDLESYFILDFVENFGVYPICNNRSGFEILKHDLNIKFKIDWKYFN